MADYAAEESHDTMVSDSTDTEYPMDMEDKDVRALHGDLEESRILIEQSVLSFINSDDIDARQCPFITQVEARQYDAARVEDRGWNGGRGDCQHSEFPD